MYLATHLLITFFFSLSLKTKLTNSTIKYLFYLKNQTKWKLYKTYFYHNYKTKKQKQNLNSSLHFLKIFNLIRSQAKSSLKNIQFYLNEIRTKLRNQQIFV